MLAGTALAAPALADTAQLDSGSSDFDCTQLAEEDEPDSAVSWYERSLWAGHCYVFQARAVRIGSDGVRSLAMSHEIQDGVEREVARFLDGPAVAFEREGRIARLGGMAPGKAPSASPEAIVGHLDGLYRLQLSGSDRIAGRHAMRLDIEPLDDQRYGHRLWLDAATALPLKQMLLDERGRVVETFQITELRSPQLYQGRVGLAQGQYPPRQPWQPRWLPEGFVAQPVKTHGERRPGVRHRVYGDGLSTLSLFVEPLENRDLLIPGIHRLGVSHAAVLHRELGGQPRQVVAMGELPPQVLRRVVESVVWAPEAPTEASASDAEDAP
ncbi:MucB/RseB C-terminal domain-containing protein [Halomonas organivorans]|uniref:Sigma-E factor negative regulatory protein RseB n=1 Tax=Halomonas organivorans TaxID=257772 RepID=A0A7W5G439_9GAMM|nr:MucB/RseB C-terminal domain-containing protein [Halomonas organivorans]MBB3140013.1 sigma-E factor negative regulatory protein RseB [Halomonas organivorans]